MKKMFQIRCEKLDKLSQRDSRTLSQTGLTTGKATATNTARLHQMSRSILTGKEDKSLAVNSCLAFETKTNFELNPEEKGTELLKVENGMSLVWHCTQHMHIFKKENSRASQKDSLQSTTIKLQVRISS